MRILGKLAVIAVLWAGGISAAYAQSTDGYHAIQVFPVVVDTASFTQRFHFRAAEPWEGFPVSVRYYPAQGTAQVGPLDCPPLAMPPFGELSFASLRELCPGLVAGSAFGTLVLRAQYLAYFAAYSRVSNSAGAGFSVEGFPANTFTSAITAVSGLRRRAASSASPAYQSNCFVGSLAELSPGATPVNTDVEVKLVNSAGTLLGKKTVAVMPGQIVRLLDVFAAAGVPAGDREDVVATFRASGSETPGLLSFCTVQDNTSFGADFRIGKQEFPWGGASVGAQDETALRIAESGKEQPVDNEVEGASFAIPAGATRNIHLFYFRHPDLVTCGPMNPSSPAAFLNDSYGLEVRLRVQDANGTWRTIAGGNDVSFFDSVYLGDKPDQGRGANTRYLVEVESNGQNDGANRPYILSCMSGSGSTRGELLRKGLPTAF